MNVTFLTSTFHTDPVGIHAKFHDTIQYLDLTDNPPFQWDLVTCNLEEEERQLSADAFHSNGRSKLEQVSRYMSHIRRKNDRTSIFHLNQTDFRLAVPTILAASDSIPLVIGPNVSTYHRPGLKETLPKWSRKYLKLHFRVSSGYRNRLLYHEMSPISQAVDAVLAFSDHHSEKLAESGVNPSKIRTLPSGVRPDIFYPESAQEVKDIPTFLFVGNAQKEYWKGFDILVDALSRLQEDRYEFHVKVVGTPPRRETKQRISDLQLENSVKIVGRVPRDQLPEYYRHADALINPSRYETEGMTSVEARACGTPVIGSDIGAFKNKNSLTFSSGDAMSLYQELCHFLDGREQYRNNARATADEWSSVETIDFLTEVYQSLDTDCEG